MRTENRQRTPFVAVLVATKDRPMLLARRALASVQRQSRAPDLLVVVDDGDRRFRDDVARAVADVRLTGSEVRLLANQRTAGASGAWNTGLAELARLGVDPCDVVVAVLDDDDEWSPGYLEACVSDLSAASADMVATALVRRGEAGTPDVVIEPPARLVAGDFLVGNPGIQGSNLFVRLSVLLAAGMFDEALRSSTDRDLCIRIAALGWVRCAKRPQVLVTHHVETRRTRLKVMPAMQKLNLSRLASQSSGARRGGERRAWSVARQARHGTFLVYSAKAATRRGGEKNRRGRLHPER